MTISTVYEDSIASFNAAESWFGKNFNGAMVFTGDNGWADYDGSVAGAINVYKNTGGTTLYSIPLIAVGANLHDAGTGAYDSHYVSAAKQLAAANPTGPIYVRTGWEFNGTWEPWSAQADPADYIAAYRQFVDSYRTVSNRFVFTWCPGLGAGDMNPETAYPGDAYVDIIGTDMYYNKTYQTGDAAAFNYFVNMPYGLQWQQDFAAAHGKQTATAEWGVNSDTTTQFMALAAQWFTSHNEVYETYWDSNAGGFSGKLSSGAMPDAGAAFKTAIGAITSPAAATVTPPPPVPAPAPVIHKAVADFDADGKSDLLLRNAKTGDVQVWESGAGLNAAHAVDLGVVGLNMSVVGVGDFDGDGKADVLWRGTNGDVQLWESTRGLGVAHTLDLGVVSTAWTVAGVGDFDGDGKADVLWRNANGDVQVWESTRGLGAAHTLDLGVVGTQFAIVGVGDFDGDGKTDILWRNATTGDVQLWETSRGLGAAHTLDLGVVSKSLVVAGVGDFDGDGKADILFRNTTTGDIQVWESSKGLDTAHAVDLGVVSAAWQVVGVGDYDGDGKADVLFRNTTTGDVQAWESSHGLGPTHAVDLGVVSASLVLQPTIL